MQEYPQGVIYVEITEPKSLPEQLAFKMGMRLGPTDVVDVFLGYLSSGYKHYYELPPDPLIAFDFVIETFKGAARRYKAKSGNILTIFIGGIDLLAKIAPDAFISVAYMPCQDFG